MTPLLQKWKAMGNHPIFHTRFFRCMGISVLVHGGLLFIFFFIFLIQPGGSEDETISISFIQESEKGETEKQEKSKDKSSEKFKEDSQKTQEMAENLKNTQKPLDLPSQESADQKKYGDLKSTEANIGKNVELRSKYGRLPPRTFYGMALHAKNILFILDVSGSMDIVEARVQLKNGYHDLTHQETFGIIGFAEQILCWREEMSPGTPENKQEANAWVDRLPHGGFTNLYSALEKGYKIASQFPNTEIYIVTDGRANDGPITSPDEILKKVKEWRKEKKVKIHVIGLGLHQDYDFLKKLTQETGGNYHERP